MVLNLDEEAVRAENVAILPRDSAGLVHLAGQQGRGHLPTKAGGRADESLVELSQQFAIDPRAVVEALQIRPGGKLHQVPPAGLVHRQQQQMVSGVADVARCAVRPRGRGDVGFRPQDGLDAGFDGGGVKVDGPEEVPVVGQRQGFHAVSLGRLDQVAQAVGAVKEGILRVDVKVNETIHSRLRAILPKVSVTAEGAI